MSKRLCNFATEIKNQYIMIKTDIELSNGIMADVFCCNGYAIAVEQSEVDRNMCYFLTYPILEDVLADQDMTNEVLTYCGLYDLQASDLNYGDIMLTYGKVDKVNSKETLLSILNDIAREIPKCDVVETEKLLYMFHKNVACILVGFNMCN